jgi:hypothetical protein
MVAAGARKILRRTKQDSNKVADSAAIRSRPVQRKNI